MPRISTHVFSFACAVALSACVADPVDSFAATTTAPPETTSVATFPANGESVDVSSIDNTFLPETLEVVAGTEVVFTNNGRNPHNVVPAGDPEAVTWGVLEAEFDLTDSYARVFDRPGTYVYYCTIHGSERAGMVGTVIVTAP